MHERARADQSTGFNSTTHFVTQRPALVKGQMQLFSVEQQRSQALEAHASAFGTLKVRICGSMVR